MESIKELRTLLQEEKINPLGWRRPWGYKVFQRGPSIYITRALIPTRITPNQVTIAGILIGLAGCWDILSLDWHYKLFGVFLLYLSILADKVDGELARYRKTYSLSGIYWDEISHLIIPPLFWISLAWGISDISIYGDRRFLIIVSALGALALMANRVIHSLAPQIFAKKYIKYADKFNLPQRIDDIIQPNRSQGIIKTVARAIHHLQDFFIIISITAVIIILEVATRRDILFHPLLAYFVALMSPLFIFFAIENTIRKARSIETDITKIKSTFP